MCGRYLISNAPAAIREMFRYPEVPNFPPRYNVAPTQPVPVVRMWEGQRQFALVRWGLIPAWVKDPKAFSLLINARSDSVIDKPSFANAMKRRRCLFPADGFYEWMTQGGRRQPYAILPRDGGPIAFAGLWEAWMGPNGEEMETAAIVTTVANRTLHPIHKRMPVVIPPAAFEMWLDCVNVDAVEATSLLMPAPEEFFEPRRISAAVNHVANDSADLLNLADESEDADAAAKPRRAARAVEDSGQGSLF